MIKNIIYVNLVLITKNNMRLRIFTLIMIILLNSCITTDKTTNGNFHSNIAFKTQLIVASPYLCTNELTREHSGKVIFPKSLDKKYLSFNETHAYKTKVLTNQQVIVGLSSKIDSTTNIDPLIYPLDLAVQFFIKPNSKYEIILVGYYENARLEVYEITNGRKTNIHVTEIKHPNCP